MLTNKDYRFKRRNIVITQISNAKSIWADIKSSFSPWENCNSFCMFRREFQLSSTVASAKMRIAVDTKMCLYINGTFVKRALYSGVNSARIYDEIDVAKYLNRGRNLIAVLALHYGYDTIYGQTDKPSLIFDCAISLDGGEKINIFSDKNTKTKICKAYDKFSPRISMVGGCVEVFNNSLYEDGWNSLDFDDSNWQNAYEEYAEFPSNFYDKSMTFKKAEEAHDAKAIVSASGSDESNEKDLLNKITEEINMCKFNHMYMVGSSCEITPCEMGKMSYVVVKFSKQRRGRIVINCDGLSGDVIDVVYGDNFQSGEFKICGLARFTLKNGENILETRFDDYTFKYVMLIVRNHVKTLKINNVSMIADRYKFDSFMEFNSNNEEYENMFTRITNDIKNLYIADIVRYDGYQPKWHLRETRWQNFAYSIISGDDAHLKRNIIKYAELIYEQGYRNKIFAHNKTEAFVRDSLVWISSFKDLADFTDETYLFERYINRIISTLRWVTNFENEDGLLTGLETPGFCSTSINCMYVDAIQSVVKITKDIEAISEYTFFKNKLRNILKVMKEKFWNEEVGLYCDGLMDGVMVNSYGQDANSLAIVLLHEKGERRIKTIVKNGFENQKIELHHTGYFVKAMIKAKSFDIVFDKIKEGLDSEAEGIFLVEGILGVDMNNLKEGIVKPYAENGVNYRAKLKTRFRTLEIEVKNSKIKIR